MKNRSERLAKIFKNGENNLVLAVGYGEYYPDCWEFDAEEFADRDFIVGNLEFSGDEGINFVTDYTDPDVKNIIKELHESLDIFDEDNLFDYCHEEDIRANDCWDVVICLNSDGDIVIHSVRDDGMIADNLDVIKEDCIF